MFVKMHLIPVNPSIFNWQSVKLPIEIYNSLKFNQFIFITIDEKFKVLSKVELNDEATFTGVFMPTTVVKPFHSDFFANSLQRHILKTVLHSSGVEPISNICVAKIVELTVVMNNTKSLHKLKRHASKVRNLICDILQLFAICKGCVVFLDQLHEVINFGCYCLVIHNLPGKEDDVFTVSEKTVINIRDIRSKDKAELEQNLKSDVLFNELFSSESKKVGPLYGAFSSLVDVLTLTKTCNQLPSNIKLNKNVLIAGQPGCGKSSLVKSAARRCGFIVRAVCCSDLNTTNVSNVVKKLKETFLEASLNAFNDEPCLILLKNLDLLFSCRNENTLNRNQIVLKQLCSLLDGVVDSPGISVISTSNSPEVVGDKLKRVGRFNEELEVPILLEGDRENVMYTLSKLFEFSCDEKLASQVAKWTPGFVLADLMFVVREALHFLSRERPLDETSLERCFKKSVSQTTAMNVKGTRGLLTSCKTKFSDIGGLEHVQKLLQMSVLWHMSHPELFARLGIPPTKGILLYGPPGCAKTMLVKALAHESNTTFLAVSSADLYSPYVGESEKRLVKLFSQARIAAPAIIFIDEIDALVGKKEGSRDRGVQERILATLLVELDGIGNRISTTDSLTKIAEGDRVDSTQEKTIIKNNQNNGVIVIGATNRPDLIDEALKRPGRFDKLIFVPPPDRDGRLSILRTVTSEMALDHDVDLTYIADQTERFSGADLKSLCTEAALYSLSSKGMGVPCISSEDFNCVLKTLTSSLSSKMIQYYSEL